MTMIHQRALSRFPSPNLLETYLRRLQKGAIHQAIRLR